MSQQPNEGHGEQTIQPDPARPQNEHGPSDFDTKHYVSVFGLWDLPVFRTRADWIGRGFGGLEINGVLHAQTGFPCEPLGWPAHPSALTKGETNQPNPPWAPPTQPPARTA